MSYRVRVEEQFIGIETVTVLGFVGPMHAITVDGARTHVREIAMKDLVRVFRQFNPFQLIFAVIVENADLDFGGVGREKCEIGSLAVPGSASGMGKAFLDRDGARFSHSQFGHYASCTT